MSYTCREAYIEIEMPASFWHGENVRAMTVGLLTAGCIAESSVEKLIKDGD